MSDRERAAELADEIEREGMVTDSEDDPVPYGDDQTKLVVAALRAYAEPAPANVREAVAMAISDMPNNDPSSLDIADAALSALQAAGWGPRAEAIATSHPAKVQPARWRARMTYDELVEKAARAVMVDDGCGFTLETGERVFCDDERLETVLDPAGRTYRQGRCTCKAGTRAALAVVYEVLKKPSAVAVKTGTDARWSSAVRDANNVREIWSAMLAASPLNPKGPTDESHT